MRQRMLDAEQALTGNWTHRRRQVIDLPIAPVTITEPVTRARHRGACGHACVAHAHLGGASVWWGRHPGGRAAHAPRGQSIAATVIGLLGCLLACTIRATPARRHAPHGPTIEPTLPADPT